MATARAAQGEQRARTAQGRLVSEKVVEEVKVKRHWAGKALQLPDAPAEEEDNVGFLVGATRAERSQKKDPRLDRLVGAGRQRATPELIEETGRERPRSLDSESDDVDDEATAERRRRRRRTEPELIEAGAHEEEALGSGEIRAGDSSRHREREDMEEEEEEEEEEIEMRRERARLLAKRRRMEEEQQMEGGGQSDEDEMAADEEEEQSSSSYETDSDDDDAPSAMKMLKPVFITASERETIKEREAIEAQEEAMRAAREERAKQRQVESRALLVEAIRKEEEGGGEEKALDFEAMPDDNDDEDELGEFELWKLRELKRVRREREEAEEAARAAAEVERRRKLTDAERKKEDEEFAKQRADYNQEKAKWKFLQKYYHKGAFYQDEDDTGNKKLGPVLVQDFGAATGKDAIGDKQAMPKVMQVKNFGMRSQVKWTHLTAEDTSSKEALWATNQPLFSKSNQKLAGNKGAHIFERPSKKQR